MNNNTEIITAKLTAVISNNYMQCIYAMQEAARFYGIQRFEQKCDYCL